MATNSIGIGKKNIKRMDVDPLDLWKDTVAANVGQVLFDEQTIQAKVTELAKTITADYLRLGAEKLLVVGILRGSVLFMSDLIRKIDLPLEMDFMAVSSYGHGAISSGQVKISKDISKDIRGLHVLLVEDIVDTGRTLATLRALLQEREPKSIAICTLLDKPSRRVSQVKVEYTGFTIPDEFVVGYGLDYADQYRHLPYIGVLKPEVYQQK